MSGFGAGNSTSNRSDNRNFNVNFRTNSNISRLSDSQSRFLTRILNKIRNPDTFTFRDVDTLEEFRNILEDGDHWYNKITRLAHESYFIAVKIPQYKYCRFGGLFYSPETEPTSLELWNYTNMDYKLKMEHFLHFRICETEFPEILEKLYQIIPVFRNRIGRNRNYNVNLSPDDIQLNRIVQEQRETERNERERVQEIVRRENENLIIYRYIPISELEHIDGEANIDGEEQIDEQEVEERTQYIPLIIIYDKELVLPEDTTCCICMENKIQGLTNCNHYYCSNCIDTYCFVNCKDTCPICRTKLINYTVKE